MKRLTKEELDSIYKLSKEMEDLKPFRDRYFEVYGELGGILRRKEEQDQYDNYDRLSIMCEYEEPTYPHIGQIGLNGSAYFHNEQDAKNLIEALKLTADYTKGYELEWSKPGRYVAEPTYRFDHDRDIVYTVTFRRSSEQD